MTDMLRASLPEPPVPPTEATTARPTVPAGPQPPRGTDSEASAIRHVRRITAGAGTSFYWAMRLLPRARRDAVFAVYAFCREVDDIADEPAALPDKRRRLDQWRREVAGLYAGHAGPSPTGRALRPAVARFDLQRADFDTVIDGMQTDAERTIVAPRWTELETYIDAVACAVGRLCVRIFGAPGDDGRRVAEALGRALQLTNILRDLAEDAGRGRLYVPAELLDSHGIAERDPATVLRHPAMPAICRALAREARVSFAHAEAAMARCPPGSMRPARVMMQIYRRMLDRLVAADWQDPLWLPRSRRLVGRFEKVAIGLRYGLLR